MQYRITESEARALLDNRHNNRDRGRTSDYKATKRRLMGGIRSRLNLPRGRIVIAIEDPTNPLYCVVRSKGSGKVLDDGRPDPQPVLKADTPVAAPVDLSPTPAAPAAPAAPVAAVAASVGAVSGAVKAVAAKKAATKTPAAKKAPAKKVAAKKAVAVKKPAAKAPAKKVAAKKAAPAKKPAAKAPAKKAAPAKAVKAK